MAGAVEASMHEHVARTMYYFGIHMLYASIVGCTALALTSIRSGSATTKYWIWVVTTLNFIVPTGALIDKLWAPHLAWAAPLGLIGDAAWSLTQGRTAAMLALVWVVGTLAMLIRLAKRIRMARREAQYPVYLGKCGTMEKSLADSFPVTLHDGHQTAAPQDVLRPR